MVPFTSYHTMHEAPAHAESKGSKLEVINTTLMIITTTIRI
jgi:hypothetical protein